MFNLFPKKKSVDDIIEDADLTPPWQWTPTQTPSMLLAQNELIEQFLKENHDLKLENQKLKNDIHQPELCNEKITELTKEVLQLRHLKQENADLMEILAKYRDGYQGSCYACEPVGELNQKLELQVTALHKIIEGAKNEIDQLKEQKHPMYPLHWSGCDGAASAYPEQYSKWLNEQKDLTIEETKDKVRKMTPWVEEPIDWNGEKSWEEAAGDLALRVVKLEKKVEELTLIKICQKQS